MTQEVYKCKSISGSKSAWAVYSLWICWMWVFENLAMTGFSWFLWIHSHNPLVDGKIKWWTEPTI